MKPPRMSPCGSCPYRQDCPSGVWHEEEYDKLPTFDGETWQQPESVFMCHQQDGHLCAGWVAVHDMGESMGLRIALLTGALTMDGFDACLDYETKVPLFSSGEEARAHGLAEYESPGDRAERLRKKLRKTKDVTIG